MVVARAPLGRLESIKLGLKTKVMATCAKVRHFSVKA